MKPRVLVVDDEPDVRGLIATHLVAHHYEVQEAGDGPNAIKMVNQEKPSLVILDVMLPGLSGLEVCKQLKREGSTAMIPIIMLTAKSDEIDRVLGFELGAVDYVTKPFSPRELMLRARVAIGRIEGPGMMPSRLTSGEITLDRETHEVWVGTERIVCTATEFKLLTVLMERKGRTQERDRLLADVWGYDALIDTRTVDTHMRRLRDKLGRCCDYVETVRGFGYRFVGFQG